MKHALFLLFAATGIAAAQTGNTGFLLGPSDRNYVFLGDSLFEGTNGDPALANQSMAAVVQGLGVGQAPNALTYDLGFRTETTGQVGSQYYGRNQVTATLTTTSGSVTATVNSATGITNGMCIGSANTQPNTTVTISGTTVTLSKPATATGGVPCSISTNPTNLLYGELYPGGAANSWLNFKGSAHQLSPAVSGIAGTVLILLGANDYLENTNATFTMTCTTTAGSPNVTVTSGTFSSIAPGNVLTSANLPASLPPSVISGAGTAQLVLSANASTTGSVVTTVHVPTTTFAAWTTAYSGLIAAAHADGYTVATLTLPPAGNSTGQGSPVSNAFRTNQWNPYILANTTGADYVFDITTVLPPYGSVVGSPYFDASDHLHFSDQGNAVLGKFINQQFFSQVFPGQLAWSPFSTGALPDSWLGTDIPRTDQTNIFNPGSNVLSTMLNLTAGSNIATVTGSTDGIYPGMYLSVFGGGAFKTTTTVVSISGNTLTLSDASQKTVNSEGTAFGYTQFPGATVFKGDLYLGPALDLSGGACSYVHFTSQGDSFIPGLLWENISGATTFELVSNTSTSGSLFLGAFSNTSSITFNSNGTTTIKGSTLDASSSDLTAGSVNSNGDIVVATAGKGLKIKEGANGRQGTGTLVNGVVTIGNTSVTAISRIFLSGGATNGSTAIGMLHVTSQIAGVGFTVTSLSAGATPTTGDQSSFTYEIFEPSP